jgi:hypothetical protein
MDDMPWISQNNASWKNIWWSGILKSDAYSNIRWGLLYLPSNWSYNNNEYVSKAQAMPLRPFSNTFAQPDSTWTRLDA